MDQNPKQLIVEKLKSANNVLVTVSKDPNVDQLTAALGLTLMLNALEGHALTVFSGQIPNALEFLSPERSFDNTVDSLRDFIISIDKEKADKLRYKVEDNVVKIFITPYKTTLSEDDLSFSQGDFNVDVVVALGVNNKVDLDQAITAHGRILHDATIVSITAGNEDEGDLGAINWHDPSASSLSEMLVSMSEALQSGILDKAMSTAFLTGIVSATERFSNDKTSPKVMTMAAQLMAAGADQQLISKNLRMDRGRTKDLEISGEGVAPMAKPTKNEDPSVLKLRKDDSKEIEKSLEELQHDIDGEQSSDKTSGDENKDEGKHTIIQEVKGQSAKSTELADDKEPSLGGVFNATSKSAHDDMVASRADSMNKEILNHDIEPPEESAEDIEFMPEKPHDKKSEERRVPTMVTAEESQNNQAAGQKEEKKPEKDELDEARNAVEAAIEFNPAHHPTEAIGAQPVEMVGAEADVNTQIQIDETGQISSASSDEAETPVPQVPQKPDSPLVDPGEPTLPPPVAPPTINKPGPGASLTPEPSPSPPPPAGAPVIPEAGPSLDSIAPPPPVPEGAQMPPPLAPPPLPPKPDNLPTQPSTQPKPPQEPKIDSGTHGYMSEPPDGGPKSTPDNPLFTQQL